MRVATQLRRQFEIVSLREISWCFIWSSEHAIQHRLSHFDFCSVSPVQPHLGTGVHLLAVIRKHNGTFQGLQRGEFPFGLWKFIPSVALQCAVIFGLSRSNPYAVAMVCN